ncbi:MAG: PaaI family thioesterase [Candidatus Binataceae bacterium]
MTDALAVLERYRMPFAEVLGVRVISASAESVTAEMLVRGELCTVGGILHGGALMALADTLGAYAAALNLREGASTTTIESKTNFFAPAPAGSKVIAECLALHRGRSTTVWQTRVTSDLGRLLALITQTQMMLERKSA